MANGRSLGAVLLSAIRPPGMYAGTPKRNVIVALFYLFVLGVFLAWVLG
jgi:hypothetical protein